MKWYPRAIRLPGYIAFHDHIKYQHHTMTRYTPSVKYLVLLYSNHVECSNTVIACYTS